MILGKSSNHLFMASPMMFYVQVKGNINTFFDENDEELQMLLNENNLALPRVLGGGPEMSKNETLVQGGEVKISVQVL